MAAWNPVGAYLDSRSRMQDLRGDAAYGAALQDPSLFQGAVPGAQPMPGGPPSDTNAMGPQPSVAGRDLPPFAQPMQGGGFDPNAYLARTAQLESGGSANPSVSSAGAMGKFQFMPSTAKQYGLTNPNDPSASASAALRLADDNRRVLSAKLGREPTAAETYLAHQQGAGGASALLTNPGARAVDVLTPLYGGNQATALKAIVGNGGSPDMTAGQFAQLWVRKFNGLPPLQAPAQTGMPSQGMTPPAQDTTVGMPPSGGAQRFGTDSPPVAGPGGAVAGGPPAQGAAPPAPQPSQSPPVAIGGGPGLDMQKIMAAVMRANPNARPEVVAEAVKHFAPVLAAERGQGNTDRSFAANRDDESRRRFTEDRTYNTGREDKAAAEEKPVSVGYGADLVRPKTGEVVYSGRDRPATGAGANGAKLDAGTMKAIRENESNNVTLKNSIDVFDSVLNPDAKTGKSLNDIAYSGPFAEARGYAGSIVNKKGNGAATEVLGNRINSNAIANLKAAFGANPTEGERKVLLDLAGSVNKAPEVRREIYERAKRLAQDRLEFNKQQTEEMRAGTYYRPGGGTSGGGAAPGGEPTVIDGISIRRVQ